MTATKGIYFKTTLDHGPIQLDYRADLPIGTTIRVRIPAKTSLHLRKANWYQPEDDDWDWYCLKRPSVRRLRTAEEQEISQRWLLPDENEPLPPGWHSTKAPGLKAIHWTYSRVPRLTCNGIRVEEAEPVPKTAEQHWRWSPQSTTLHDFGGFRLQIPNLLVFDPDGNLPLNLQRTELDHDHFREGLDHLLEDVVKDYIAFMLVHAPTEMSVNSLVSIPMYAGLSGPSGRCAAAWPWIASKEGISIADEWILHEVNPKGVLHIVTDIETFPESALPQMAEIDSYDAVIASEAGIDLDSRTALARSVIMPGEHQHAAFRLAVNGVRFITTTELLSTLNQRLPQFIKRELHEEWNNGTWVSLTRGKCLETGIRVPDLKHEKITELKRRAIIAEWFVADDVRDCKMTPISRAWRKVVKSPMIPYDKDKRRTILSSAYKELELCIDRYEADLAKQGHK